MADPFDFSGSDPNAPGFLGQSQGFWQNLARFGGNLAAAANARDGRGFLVNGTGLAGPLGAAIGQTMQQGQQSALYRADIMGKQASTQGQLLQNQSAASGLPVTQARNAALARIWGGIGANGMVQPMGGASGGQAPTDSGALNVSNGGQPELAPMAHRMESGGSMQPGITGDGGAAAGPMQVHQAALDDVNKATGNNYSLDQVRSDPLLGYHVGQAYLHMQQQRFPGRPDLALAAYNAGPTAVGNAVAGGQPVPGQGYARQAMAGQPPAQAGGFQMSPQQALSLANDYEAKANTLEAQLNQAKVYQGLGVPVQMPVGDPAALRTAAQQYRTMALAGPTEAAKADQQITTDRFGNRYRGTQYLGRGSEVREVFNPASGNYEWGDVGALGANGQPAAGAPGTSGNAGAVAKPGPGSQEFLQGPAQVQKSFIEHDNKMVDEDLAHVIENVGPAKQQLFQLRSLNEQANPGAASEFRLAIKNWAQTFVPSIADQLDLNAAPAQEFKKIALMGAGKQERGDLGARGGFRAIELYLHANPSLENQPTSNRDMSNALLVSHQYHEDYATGATDFFNKQVQGVQQSGTTRGYQKLSGYDQQFIQKMRPELYASAIGAINGKPYTEWSKGLTGPQLQIVGGILQRADPNAVVDLGGHQVPVSAFKTTIGPMQLGGGASGG